MNIHPIKTKKDYEHALKRIEMLMDAVPDTPEGDELEVLATLVEVYEEQKYAICPPDPIAAILFRMEQLGLSRKDVEPIFGSRGRISEVLNHKRSLSLNMIHHLHKKLKIPLESLISTRN